MRQKNLRKINENSSIAKHEEDKREDG